MFVAVDAQLAHRHGETFGARHHMGIRAGVVGKRFNIEERRARQVARQILRRDIAHGLLARRQHAGVQHLHVLVGVVFI